MWDDTVQWPFVAVKNNLWMYYFVKIVNIDKIKSALIIRFMKRDRKIKMCFDKEIIQRWNSFVVCR